MRDLVRFRAEEEGGERSWACLLGGGALVLVSAALIGFIAYHAVYLHKAGESGAMFWLGLAFFPYATGVFIFSLGYELNDSGRALKLTLVILVFSVVVVAAAAFALVFMSEGAEVAAGSGGTRNGRTVAALASEFSPESGEDELKSQMFTVQCERCGELFAPVPPKAICPFCGWEAVTIAIGDRNSEVSS
jgi:hypothetical protein